MPELRRTALYRALHRPHLFMGGERELVMVTAIVCAGVAVSSLNMVAIVVAVSVWAVLIGIFRIMAKADPYMSKVYLRQIQYLPYYPARSRASRRH